MSRLVSVCARVSIGGDKCEKREERKEYKHKEERHEERCEEKKKR
jgi:hypothetical protein